MTLGNKKKWRGGAAAFVFLGTEKSDPDQSEAEGAVNLPEQGTEQGANIC